MDHLSSTPGGMEAYGGAEMTQRDTGYTGQLDGFPDLDGGGAQDFDFMEVCDTCFCSVSNILIVYNVVGSQCDHKQCDYGSRYS